MEVEGCGTAVQCVKVATSTDCMITDSGRIGWLLIEKDARHCMGIACSSFHALLLRHLYTPNYIAQVILIEVLHLLLFIVVVVRFVC